MADYKHRASPKRKPQKKSPSGGAAWWFSGGFLLGAFAMGLVWLKFAPQMEAGQIPGVRTTHQPAPKKKAKRAPKPEFQFYTILPEMEVVVPDEETLPPRKPVAQTQQEHKPPAKTKGKDRGTYILQMGSYRRFADADRMKARLALIGIQAEIQKISINNKDTFLRVRSGPYHSTAELQPVRRLAKANNISTLVIRLKK